MGIASRLAACGGVIVVAIVLALRVAPLERAEDLQFRSPLAPVLSALAYPPEADMEPIRDVVSPRSRQSALAVPMRKPRVERPVEKAAIIASVAPRYVPGDTGIERPAPSGYLDFCRRRADICTVGGARQAALTSTAWNQLVSVNSYFDDTIEPKTDLEALGLIEHWDIPGGPDPVGDCEDFALAKKARLIALGWPRSALLLAVANIRDAEPAARRHAVLIVITDEGNFVLDNRRKKILTWEEAGYDWVSIQSPTDAYKWVAISTDKQSKLVTASGVPDITRNK